MLSRGKNILIGTLVGVISGFIYYWLVWENLFYSLFGFETNPENIYIFIVSFIFCIGFSVNFGVEFGFDNKEIFYNILYVFLAVVYITAYTGLLGLLIWSILNPVARFFLVLGLIAMFLPAGKHFVLVVFIK